MKIQFYFNLTICLMFVFSSCAKLKPKKLELVSSCRAETCHPSTPLQEYPPKSGKHEKHLAKGYICENCHNQYLTNSHHKDTILDKDLDTELVFFDNLNPNTNWDNTTGDCNNIQCHGQGSAKINWYAPFNGSCAACHAPESSIDPLTTSGSGVSGKHVAHVTNKGIGCEVCHEGYRSDSNHMNNIYGKNESDTIIIIDIDGSQGSPWGNVTADFNDSTGQCDNISCHSGTGGVTWYSDSSGCTACHSPGSSIDPMTTSGSGTDGKHSAHVTNKGIGCEICHENYKSDLAHMNGTYGKLEATTLLIFDTDGSQGSSWGTITATFNDSSGQCDNISCHGNTGGVTWYAASTGCTACHSSGSSIDPMTTSGSGTDGKHSAHVTNKGIGCEICHENYKSDPDHMNSTYGKLEATTLLIFDTDGSQGSSWGTITATFNDSSGQCDNISCHGNTGGVTWYAASTGCTACHSAGSLIDPLTTSGSEANGKHITHYMDKSIDCEICHEDYKSDPDHMNGTYGKLEPTSIMAFDADGSQGSSWGSVSLNFNDTNGQCNTISCHGINDITDQTDWYTTNTGCLVVCHKSSRTTGPVDPLTTNDTGTSGKHIKHVTDQNLPCGKCHFDYDIEQTHVDGILDTANSGISLALFDTANPSGSWTNDTGAGTGDCQNLNCHGASTLEWYGTNTWTLPGCDTCHSSAFGNIRQVRGAGGDFDKESHHVIDYANRTTEIILNSDCSVCHDLSAHMGGAVKLNNKDNPGATITYDPLTPSSLEPFCLSCHDADGATTEASPISPFSDSNTLGIIPNEAGNKISGYWNNTYTKHKDNGLTCAGSGDPGTGCHGNNGSINMHGSISRGLLTKNMDFPVPPSGSDPTPRDPGNQVYIDYINNLYKLCFECHNNYPVVTKETVLGYREGGNYDLSWAPTPYYSTSIQSLFRDVWTGGPEIYDDTIWGDPNIPLHNYHLLSTDGWMQNVWAYRGYSGETGRASCTTCHNVHGTSGSVRSTYDEFGVTAFTNGSDEYKTFVPGSNYNDSVMKVYPIFCAVSCHGVIGATYYWYEPSNE